MYRGAGVRSSIDLCMLTSTTCDTSLAHSLQATRPGGTVLLVGMGTPVMTLPLGAAALREVDLRGVFRYSNTYPEAVELVSRHDPNGPDFSKLVTHRFKGFEQAEKAFQMAGRTKDDDGKLVIKVVIEAGQDEQ